MSKERGAFFLLLLCALCFLSLSLFFSLFPNVLFQTIEASMLLVMVQWTWEGSKQRTKNARGAARQRRKRKKRHTQKNGALFFSLDGQELLLALLLLRNDTSSSKRVLPRERHVQEAVDVLVLVVDVCHEGGC